MVAEDGQEGAQDSDGGASQQGTMRIMKRQDIIDGKLRVNDMVITDEFILANNNEPLQAIVEKLLRNPGDALLIAEACRRLNSQNLHD